MKKVAVSAAALLVIFTTGTAVAFEASYVSTRQLDLSKVLAPAPTPNSDLDRRDLSEVLWLQQNRTASQAERAIADNEQSLLRIVGEVFGDKATALSSAKFSAFYQKMNEDTRSSLRPKMSGHGPDRLPLAQKFMLLESF